jgi:hypothetical protein
VYKDPVLLVLEDPEIHQHHVTRAAAHHDVQKMWMFSSKARSQASLTSRWYPYRFHVLRTIGAFQALMYELARGDSQPAGGDAYLH